MLVYKHTDFKEPRQELVGITSKGFVYRGKIMRSIEDVVQFFKEDEAKKMAKKLIVGKSATRPSDVNSRPSNSNPSRRN